MLMSRRLHCLIHVLLNHFLGHEISCVFLLKCHFNGDLNPWIIKCLHMDLT